MKKKSDFISSDFILLFVCYLGMVDFQKNARHICVAICPGFTKISLFCLDYNVIYLPRGLSVLGQRHGCFIWVALAGFSGDRNDEPGSKIDINSIFDCTLLPPPPPPPPPFIVRLSPMWCVMTHTLKFLIEMIA